MSGPDTPASTVRDLARRAPIGHRLERAFRRNLRHAVALPVAVLAAGSLCLVALTLHVQRLHRAVDRADVILGRGAQLSKLTAEREAALRGYLLSRDRSFLDELNAADARLSPAFDGLQDLVEDEPAALALLRAARVEVIRWRHHAAQQIDRVRDGANPREIAGRLPEGRAITADSRSFLRQFTSLEQRARDARLHLAERVTWLLIAGGVAVGLLLGFGVALATARQLRLVRRRYVAAMEEQRRAEEALAAANARLREADQRKDEFLGVLSHELRNPLAPIGHAVHVLNHADPAGDAARRARRIVERQVRHLTRLVEDLLDVKRISAGKLRLRTGDLDLADPVREILEDLRPLFVQRGIGLSFREPGRPVPVRGDAARLAQVAGNLLQNALKFTDRGGSVSVAVQVREGRAHVLVRDDGAGMAPELLARLFEPFVQGESTIERSRGGLGLGLALVRGIVELHGGAVRARSGGPGRGAELDVELPIAEPPARSGTSPPPEGRSKGAKRVLLVEDNEDAASSLRDVLELSAGHEVRIAADGQRGLEAARALHPDVILCDLGLPVLDGYEVARRLRADGALRGATLVALSGYASPEDVERSRAAGFDHHVAKPPDLPALFRLIADAPAVAEEGGARRGGG